MTADPARIELLNRAAEGRTICPNCTEVVLDLLDVARALGLPAPRKPDEDQDSVVSHQLP